MTTNQNQLTEYRDGEYVIRMLSGGRISYPSPSGPVAICPGQIVSPPRAECAAKLVAIGRDAAAYIEVIARGSTACGTYIRAGARHLVECAMAAYVSPQDFALAHGHVAIGEYVRFSGVPATGTLPCPGNIRECGGKKYLVAEVAVPVYYHRDMLDAYGMTGRPGKYYTMRAVQVA